MKWSTRYRPFELFTARLAVAGKRGDIFARLLGYRFFFQFFTPPFSLNLLSESGRALAAAHEKLASNPVLDEPKCSSGLTIYYLGLRFIDVSRRWANVIAASFRATAPAAAAIVDLKKPAVRLAEYANHGHRRRSLAVGTSMRRVLRREIKTGAPHQYPSALSVVGKDKFAT